jgi:hypothetical protein
MSTYLEDNLDDNLQLDQADVLPLLSETQFRAPRAIDQMESGNYFAAGDDPPQPQPRPQPDNNNNNNNPWWGNWLSPIPRSLGGGLAIFQRTLARGPLGGNPYDVSTWPTTLNPRLFGQPGSLSQVSNPVAAAFSNSPYSQLSNAQNNPLANLFRSMMSGTGNPYTAFGINPYGGYYPWNNPYAAFSQGGNQFNQNAYLNYLMANGGYGGYSPWGYPNTGYGGYSPWGNPNAGYGGYSPWGDPNAGNGSYSPWGNPYAGYGSYSPWASPYNLLGSFGRGGNPLGQIANGLYLYNMLGNGANGYGNGSLLNSLPYILSSVGALRSFGRGRR